ncbi:MAG: hypothetical protein P4L50_00155 [Anaerolineaceae bacterium]|nr:hypothetical protein [Anaerolineaceae bacterium]
MNDLNTLMSYIQEINSKSADEVTDEDIDKLIEFHRRQRARRASGEKVPVSGGPKLDLNSLLGATVTKPAPAQSFTRRF